MPSALSYPGVYIEEIPSGVRTITGVATSITAFVGYTRRGTPDKAEFVTSYADFERSHGGLDRDSPLSYGVRQFFLNGGTQALIVRVAGSFASAAWTLADAAAATVLNAEAANPGAWGNDLRLSVDRTNVRNPDAEFNLVVSQLVVQGGSSQVQVLETHRNLTLNAQSPSYAPSVISAASQVLRVKRTAGLTFTQKGAAVSKVVTTPLNPALRSISGTVDGNTPFRLELAAGNIADVPALVNAVTAAITAAGLAARLEAGASLADGSAGTTCLKLSSRTAGDASAVVVAKGAAGELPALIGLGLANGGREFTGDAQHRPAAVSDAVPGAPGNDGVRGNANQLIGNAGTKTGMQALLDVDLFNLLCVPETFDLPDDQAASVIQNAAALCESRRAFLIADLPVGKTLDNVAGWINGVLQSRNAATYFPPVKIADPLDQFRARAMAPSGTLAGVYSRTDAERGVWKAPAGTDATLKGVAQIAIPLNDLENGRINQKGVNALRNFPAYGSIAWGARTLKGADAQADEYKYVPVRRLALMIEESLYRGTQWVVFEPNDEPLWAQIRLNLGAFMNGLFRQGAFQGASPREAYFVKCDKETTTQADINLGIVNIVVGFAPLKPAEFVVIKLQQIAGQLAA